MAARNQSAAWYDPLGQTWPEGHSLDDDAWYRNGDDVDERAHVVLVETGSFTGTYTTGERDEYIYVADGAWLLYVMCLIPIFAILTFWYLVFTHEKVHCFNRKNVMAMISQTGEVVGTTQGAGVLQRCCVCLAKKELSWRRRARPPPPPTTSPTSNNARAACNFFHRSLRARRSPTRASRHLDHRLGRPPA